MVKEVNDLISRADAIEAIMKHHDGGLNQINYGLTLAKNEIQSLPSADAVIADDRLNTDRIYCSPQIAENVKVVVRCKDCYWYDKGKNDCDSWEWCKRHKFDSYDDGFCSWAKMKGGAE